MYLYIVVFGKVIYRRLTTAEPPWVTYVALLNALVRGMEERVEAETDPTVLLTSASFVP